MPILGHDSKLEIGRVYKVDGWRVEGKHPVDKELRFRVMREASFEDWRATDPSATDDFPYYYEIHVD